MRRAEDPSGFLDLLNPPLDVAQASCRAAGLNIRCSPLPPKHRTGKWIITVSFIVEEPEAQKVGWLFDSPGNSAGRAKISPRS